MQHSCDTHTLLTKEQLTKIKTEIRMLSQFRQKLLALQTEDRLYVSTLGALLAFNERAGQQLQRLQAHLLSKQHITAVSGPTVYTMILWCRKVMHDCNATLVDTTSQLAPGELYNKVANQIRNNAIHLGELPNDEQITRLSQLRQRLAELTPQDTQHAATLEEYLAANHCMRQKLHTLHEQLCIKQIVCAGSVLTTQTLFDRCCHELQEGMAVLLRTACRLDAGALRDKVADEACRNVVSGGSLQKAYDSWILTPESEPTTFTPFTDAFFSFFAILTEHASLCFMQELLPQVQALHVTFQAEAAASWQHSLGLRVMLSVYTRLELFDAAVTMLKQACQEPLDEQNSLTHLATLTNQLYCLREMWETLAQHAQVDLLSGAYRAALVDCCNHLLNKLHKVRVHFTAEQALLHDANDFLNNDTEKTADKESDLIKRFSVTGPTFTEGEVVTQIGRLLFRKSFPAREKLSLFRNTPAEQFLADPKQSREWLENLPLELAHAQFAFCNRSDRALQAEYLISTLHQLWQRADNSAALQMQLDKLRTCIAATTEDNSAEQNSQATSIELVEQHHHSSHPAASRPKLKKKVYVSAHPAEPLPTLERRELVTAAAAQRAEEPLFTSEFYSAHPAETLAESLVVTEQSYEYAADAQVEQLVTTEISSIHPAELATTGQASAPPTATPQSSTPHYTPSDNPLRRALMIAEELAQTPHAANLQRELLVRHLYSYTMLAIHHLAYTPPPAMLITQWLAPYSEIIATLYLACEMDGAVHLFKNLFAAVPQLQELITAKQTANHAAINFMVYFNFRKPQQVPAVILQQIQLTCRHLFKILSDPRKNPPHTQLALDYLAFLLNCLCIAHGQLDHSCLQLLRVLNRGDYNQLFFKSIPLETLSCWKSQLFRFDLRFTRLLAQALARRLLETPSNSDTRTLANFLAAITRELVQWFTANDQLESLRGDLNQINNALLSREHSSLVLSILLPQGSVPSPADQLQEWCFNLVKKADNASMSPQGSLEAKQHLHLLFRVTDHLHYTCQQTPQFGSSLVINFLKTLQQAPVARLFIKSMDVDQLIKQALLRQDPLMLSLALVICNAQPAYFIMLLKLNGPLKASWQASLCQEQSYQRVQAADFLYAAYSWIQWRLYNHKVNLRCSLTLWRLMDEREKTAIRPAHAAPPWALHANALRTVLTQSQTKQVKP